jgi:hypothetical protein
MSVALWYYVENGARIGPVEATEIELLIGLKAITRDTLVWEDGMQDWMAASQHFSFADAPPSVNQRGFLRDSPSCAATVMFWLWILSIATSGVMCITPIIQ